MFAALSEAISARELIVNLTLRDLRTRYRRSVLGWTWSLLNPISSVIVYTIVFSVFFRSAPPPGDPSGQDIYSLFLVSGLVAWNFISGSVNAGLGSLVASAGLIRKVYFPRVAVVIAGVGSNLVTLLIELAVVAAFFQLMGSNVLPWLPVVLVVALLQTVWMVGVALMLSVLNAFFRDMEHLIGGVLLQLVFYMTPILYPATLVEPRMSDWLFTIYELNPVNRIVAAYRALLWDLRFPDAGVWAYLIIGGIAVLIVGVKLFQHFEPRLAEEL